MYAVIGYSAVRVEPTFKARPKALGEPLASGQRRSGQRRRTPRTPPVASGAAAACPIPQLDAPRTLARGPNFSKREARQARRLPASLDDSEATGAERSPDLAAIRVARGRLCPGGDISCAP